MRKPKPSPSTLFAFLVSGQEAFDEPLPDAFPLESEQFREMVNTYANNAHWLIDKRIDLTAVCENEGWHLASIERALIGQGLTRRDAEAYADFAFHVAAVVTDDPAYLTLEQFERLTLGE